MELFFATGNQHKIKEMREILAETKIKLITAEDIEQDLREVVEDQDSFKGNALKKAREVFQQLNLATIADDSGLVVDALDGAPGVYSARFAGVEASDEENNQKLLEKLKGVEDNKRTARFICAMAVVGPEIEKVVIGSCEGKIIKQLKGDKGFGYDPLFIPKGYDKSFAQLGNVVKNEISHRSQAFKKMRDCLENELD